MHHGLGLGLVWLLLVTGVPQRAVAEEVGEARALFMAGRSAFNEGRYEAALEYFGRSYTLSGKPLLLFNIGQCHDRLRNDQQAIESFEAYLTAAPEAENRTEVEARLVIMRAAVAQQTPSVATSPATPTPTQLPTTTGGDPPTSDPVDAPAIADAPASAPTSGDSALPVGPIAVTAGGGALTVAGIVLMIVGDGALGGAQDDAQFPTTLATLQSEESSANGLFVGGQVMIGIGLAAVAGGITWWVLDTQHGTPETTTARVRLSPFGVMIEGAL